MFDVVIYNETTPVLYWNPSSETFKVLDTHLIPESVYDHLWQYNYSEAKPESRVRHNRRVVSKWLSAIGKNSVDHYVQLLSIIPKDASSLHKLLSCELAAPWEIHAVNTPLGENLVSY